MKTKNVKDIKISDKILLQNTGFEYQVMFTTDLSIKINRNNIDYWIPKSLIEIYDSLLSTHGYRLWKVNSLPDWFMEKNNIN